MPRSGLSLLRDAELIGDARAEAVLDGDPELSRHSGLAAAVAVLVDEERARVPGQGLTRTTSDIVQI